MSAVVFTAAPGYSGTYANVAAALNGLSGVTTLVTVGNTQADVWARTWAASGNIGWVSLDNILLGAGYNDFARHVAAINLTSAIVKAAPSAAVTAGTHARTTALSGAATAKGIPVTAI